MHPPRVTSSVAIAAASANGGRGSIPASSAATYKSANVMSVSLFSPGTTLAALLALNFPEARGVEAQVLMYAALVLLAITLVVNLAGAMIIRRATLTHAD